MPLSEVSCPDLEPALDVQIGNVDVSRFAPECGHALVRPAAPVGLIAPTAWERKHFVAHRHRAQQVRVVDQVLGHEVNNLSFPLNAPATPEHAGREDEPPLAFE